MMLATYRRALQRAEARLAGGPVPLHEALESIPLDVIALLYLSPSVEFPLLSAALPRLPSNDVQRTWVGSEGQALMAQSCVFVKCIVNQYERFTRTSIRHAKVLDYGCGWGRLSRLMLCYVRGENIWALDPWDSSLQHCREAALPVHLGQCDEMPEFLPVGAVTFDFAFAFSVFTHLSEKCAAAVLATLHRYVRPEGLLAVTIRPPEYWGNHSHYPAGVDKDILTREHETRGFAFLPIPRPPVDGEMTYGDTSISLEYIAAHWTDWTVVGTDLNLIDRYQVIVYLTPRPSGGAPHAAHWRSA
jgi:hypothetical protein